MSVQMTYCWVSVLLLQALSCLSRENAEWLRFLFLFSFLKKKNRKKNLTWFLIISKPTKPFLVMSFFYSGGVGCEIRKVAFSSFNSSRAPHHWAPPLGNPSHAHTHTHRNAHTQSQVFQVRLVVFFYLKIKRWQEEEAGVGNARTWW